MSLSSSAPPPLEDSFYGRGFTVTAARPLPTGFVSPAAAPRPTARIGAISPLARFLPDQYKASSSSIPSLPTTPFVVVSPCLPTALLRLVPPTTPSPPTTPFSGVFPPRGLLSAMTNVPWSPLLGLLLPRFSPPRPSSPVTEMRLATADAVVKTESKESKSPEQKKLTASSKPSNSDDDEDDPDYSASASASSSDSSARSKKRGGRRRPIAAPAIVVVKKKMLQHKRPRASMAASSSKRPKLLHCTLKRSPLAPDAAKLVKVYTLPRLEGDRKSKRQNLLVLHYIPPGEAPTRDSDDLEAALSDKRMLRLIPFEDESRPGGVVVARDIGGLFGVQKGNVSKMFQDFEEGTEKLMATALSLRCRLRGQSTNALTHEGVARFMTTQVVCKLAKPRKAQQAKECVIDWCYRVLIPVLRGDNPTPLIDRLSGAATEEEEEAEA